MRFIFYRAISVLMFTFFVALALPISAQQLNVEYTVSHPNDSSFAGGSISLAITGGFPPYAITTCDLGTTTITSYEGLNPGIYNIKVEDSIGDIVFLMIPVSAVFVWDTLNPNISQNRLEAGANGWVDFIWSDTVASRHVGFMYEKDNADSMYVHAGFSFRNDSVLVVFQGNEIALPAAYTQLIAGNTYRIHRENSVYKYYLNGVNIHIQFDASDEESGSPSSRFGSDDVSRDADDPLVIEVIDITFSPWRFPFFEFYYPHSADCNKDFNWIYTETYDGNNIPVTASIQFYDLLGRPIQAQSMNTAENKILCSETKYDIFGRQVLTTLPAPVLTTTFCYVPHFVTTDIEVTWNGQTSTQNVDYTPEFFDDQENFESLEAPFPVSQTTPGQLGWYYSNNNTYEGRVAASGYPYSRVEYFNNPLGQVKRGSTYGEAFKMGGGHELRNFVMPELGELYTVYGSQNLYNVYTDAHRASDPDYTPTADDAFQQMHAVQKVYKYISVDQHGEESVSFKDIEGKLLATCLTGQENEVSVHTQAVSSIIQPGEYADIHIPQGCENSISFGLPVSNTTFTVQDINLNFENVTSGFLSAPSPGYYRIINNKASEGVVKLEYELNYHNFALYYYDAAGHLTGTVSPQEVDYTHPPVVSAFDIGDDNVISSVNESLNISYTSTPSGDFETGHGVIYLATSAELTGGGSGCYYCTGTANGVITHYSNDFFETGLTPLREPDVTEEDFKACTGNKFLYTFTVNVKAEGVNSESLTGDVSLKAVLYQGCPNGSGPAIDKWFIDPVVSYTDFHISQQQSVWCNNLSCDMLNVARQEIELENGVETIANTDNDFDWENDGQLANLNLVVRGVRVVFDGTTPEHSKISSNQYNSLGQLIWKYSPDGNRTDYMYRKDGQVRFLQNAEQRQLQKFSYINYDVSSRPVEIGEYNPAIAFNGSSADACTNITDVSNPNRQALYFMQQMYSPSEFATCETPDLDWKYVLEILNESDGIEDTRCKDVIRYYYDEADVALSTLDITLNTRRQRFVRGKISKTERYTQLVDGDDDPAAPYSVVWFSYDELGQIEWEVHYIKGLGYKTIDYAYDFNGNVTKTIYQKKVSNEKFVHNYLYNRAKQLTEVTTIAENDVVSYNGLGNLQAKYTYYLHGPLKRKEIAGMQGVDYTYTLQGTLKAINSANPSIYDPGGDVGNNADLFGLELDYFADDYERSNTSFSDGMYMGNQFPEQFTGAIKSARWTTKDVDVVTANVGGLEQGGLQNMYGFKYNSKRNWMTDALMCTYTPSSMIGPITLLTGKYNEQNISYFINGNIHTLKRTGAIATQSDDLEYHYNGESSNTANQLNFIDNLSESPISGTNLDQIDLNYKYNEVGQMTENTLDDQYVEYDVYGKVTSVWDLSRTKKKIEYIYDANGYKIKKLSYENSSLNSLANITYYINNAFGRTMRIVDYNTMQSSVNIIQRFETPIYGLGRLGLRYSTNTVDGSNRHEEQNDAYTEYELTDHLGNVRVTFKRDNEGGVTLVTYADYYPMGMPMFGRQLLSATHYRFGYQGQFSEKCDETGWNIFDTRMYDSRIGRWFSKDMANQHWSPYMAMGNRWSFYVDANGLTDWAAVRGGGWDMFVGASKVGFGAWLIGISNGAFTPISIYFIADGATQFTAGALNAIDGAASNPGRAEKLPTTLPALALHAYHTVKNGTQLSTPVTKQQVVNQKLNEQFTDVSYKIVTLAVQAPDAPNKVVEVIQAVDGYKSYKELLIDDIPEAQKTQDELYKLRKKDTFLEGPNGELYPIPHVEEVKPIELYIDDETIE